MVAAMVGYLIPRIVGDSWGSTAGIFMSALVLTAAGNAYARWAQRPGALVRVPGIILMVPGSASVRSVLTLIQQQDLAAGQQARSEEHTSELQSLMRISYAVFCLKQKQRQSPTHTNTKLITPL